MDRSAGLDVHPRSQRRRQQGTVIASALLLGALDHPRFPRTRHQRRVQSESRGLDGTIELYVPDLGATYSACLRAGCSITLEPTQSWGDCSFRCVDPFGYEWRFAQNADRTSFYPQRGVSRGAWS